MHLYTRYLVLHLDRRVDNAKYERYGTLAAQGIDREATKHLGPGTIAMELRGFQTDRGDEYREIIARNKEREHERGKIRERMRDHTRNRGR